jgi:serine/threonine protein kinase
VKIYSYYIDNYNIYIITEFCNGGPLFDYIAEKDNIQEYEAAYIMK